uniref:Phosphohistidine phosphatase n=1 Tax=Candidatus Kentrum sp. FW TaxID=2126338 RepID=A0A450TAS2_9GAMM|nr:MAG: phosphohistidine phosphatase [Candidatus Kentron sp. FW]
MKARFPDRWLEVIIVYSVRELLLLRHAKSDWDAGAESDFERPLSKRGRRDAPRVGQWLRQKGLEPDLVISSPATRTRQTACEVFKVFGIEEDRIDWEARIYDAGLGMLLDVLAECRRRTGRVLLVGHNPGLALLLTYLCGSTVEPPPDGKVLPTATLARIGMPSDWRELQADSGNLVSLTRPTAMDAGK